MNARRLTVTETNAAYRVADQTRWAQLDFVVGQEVRLSGNHTLNGQPFHDVCDELQGRYPKGFRFAGWHPFCRCHCVPILKTEAELAADQARLLAGGEPAPGSANRVEAPPAAFAEWVRAHQTKIDAAAARGKLPRFLRDNGAVENGRWVARGFGEEARAALRAQRREVLEGLRETLLGKGVTARHPQIDAPIRFTMKGVKEAINQPHRHLLAKNRLLADIVRIIPTGRYVKLAPDTKGRRAKYHYLEIEIGGEPSYIVLREVEGQVSFYTLTDRLWG